MTLSVTSEYPLNQAAAPNLPLAPTAYEPRYQDQVNNVLRLYFTQMTGAMNNLIGTNGGQFVDCPNGLFFNTVDQTFAATNTAYPVVFNQTYLSNAVALRSGSTSEIEVTIGGIYNFQYSGQLLSTKNSRFCHEKYPASPVQKLLHRCRLNTEYE